MSNNRCASPVAMRSVSLDGLVAGGLVRAIVCLTALSAWSLVAGVPALAFTDCQGALVSLPLNQVEEARTVIPDRVRAGDAFGSPSEQQAEHDSARSRRPPELHARHVARSLERLWRIRVARSVSPRSLIVRHRLVGADPHNMRHESRSEARLHVRIVPRAPRIVCRNASHHIIEGSAVLTIAVGILPLSGRYFATVETEVRVP